MYIEKGTKVKYKGLDCIVTGIFRVSVNGKLKHKLNLEYTNGYNIKNYVCYSNEIEIV